MILIISDRTDLQVYFVMLELEKLGLEYGLFSPAEYPASASISLSFDGGVSDCLFSLESGQLVRASSIHAVWYRKPGLPRLNSIHTPHEREFAFSELRAGLRGLYDHVKDAFWISSLDRMTAAANKLGQLRLASQLGMRVPRSVFTNDPVTARDFVAANGNRVIYKSVGDVGLISREGAWDEGTVVAELYTTLLDRATIEEGISRIAACPALLQEYVDKDIELRVTVVGESIFCAELLSQNNTDALVDWRQGDIFEIEHRIHELPAPVRAQCLRLVRSYGLEFGAIDMIRRPDGDYVFLELNPNGQYGWLEALTGLQISKAIAERFACCARSDIESCRRPTTVPKTLISHR
ncbi:hypothetical protein DMB42_35565 [Nonomuraea sp. WAC 01424]|uniref:MvdC/MvdD family ATP grasp protein n=1 Tax=Nonomuraea sp. WAC 01424 TaxID=2203200 RepID=UPI000F77452D|nr:hypothetical protein [Nonomuraea sp. WAC 01424]RSN03147.1 hypothetical protein DMB42_35565 [Nonomuraea sp. WAC 01424]